MTIMFPYLSHCAASNSVSNNQKECTRFVLFKGNSGRVKMMLCRIFGPYL